MAPGSLAEVAKLSSIRQKLAVFIDKFGGCFCKPLLGAGLVLYVIYIFLSSHQCCQSSQLLSSLIFNQHAKDPHHTKTHISSSNNPTKLSHIVFGIVGSAKTWRDRGPYIDLWWRPNITRGFVWLDAAPWYPWPSSPPFRVSENTDKFKAYAKHKMPHAIRMARVILESFRLGLDGVRWFVMGDDDTVFFVDNLVEILGKYDHNDYFYIGGNSECISQNFEHSYTMAFGGGGWAISYPTARALVMILDECLKRYQTLYGSDHIIQSCIAELGVQLTKEQGFHQLDLHGDISGLLTTHPQSPLVSLHHLDYIEPIFPSMNRVQSLKLLFNASQAYPQRLLQQTICYDKQNNWSISVSWGYSVQIYQKFLPPGLLQRSLQTFYPWKNTAKPPFMFNTRPLSNDPCEVPRSFFFESFEIEGDQIVTSYVMRSPPQLQACSTSGNYSADMVAMVRVLTTLTEKIKWVGGRRDCCEVVPSNDMNVTEIKIKGCKEGEMVALL